MIKYFKKLVSMFIAIAMTLTVTIATVNALNGIITVKIDSKVIDFDVPAQIINGRTMVPMRKIFESLGAKVSWNGDTKTITSIKGNDTIIMKINSTVMTVNGVTVTPALNVPPMIVDGKTLVPVRAVADALGCTIDWDESTKIVTISTKTNLDFSNVTSAYDRIQTKNVFINSDGSLGSLVVDNNKVYIKSYDSNWNVTNSKLLNLELPLFGTFYSGQNYNYIVFGQDNPNLDKGLEVVRVVKYDKSFNKISSTSINGGDSDIKDLFGGFSSARMSENGNLLYIAFGRGLLRADDNGNHHQALESIMINTDSMQVTNFLGWPQPNYSSHSFSQYIAFDGINPITVSLGDTYPRALVMYNYDITDDKEKPLNIFDIPGNAGDNVTGTMIGGFDVTTNNYMITYNYVSDSSNMSSNRNVFIRTLPRDNYTKSAIKTVQVTNYTGKTTCSTPRLVKIQNDNYMLLWNEYNLDSRKEYSLAYVYLDGNGNLIDSIQHDNMVSLDIDMQPIFNKNKVITNVNSGTSEIPKIEFLNVDKNLNTNTSTNIEKPTVTTNPDSNIEKPTVTTNPDSNIEKPTVTTNPDSNTEKPTVTTNPDSNISPIPSVQPTESPKNNNDAIKSEAYQIYNISQWADPVIKILCDTGDSKWVYENGAVFHIDLLNPYTGDFVKDLGNYTTSSFVDTFGQADSSIVLANINKDATYRITPVSPPAGYRFGDVSYYSNWNRMNLTVEDGTNGVTMVLKNPYNTVIQFYVIPTSE